MLLGERTYGFVLIDSVEGKAFSCAAREEQRLKQQGIADEKGKNDFMRRVPPCCDL